MPKFSIIIPHAFAKCEELLKPCLESIREFTDLSQIEVIIVLNGVTDNAREYIDSLGEPFKYIWIDEPSGYPKSVNAGIKEAKGEFIILLNNDTKIFGPQWIDILYKPFSDPSIMISGPWMNYDPNSQRDFLIFFCVMLRKTIFDKIGLLDEETFSWGIGEDTDFCHKTVDAGFKIVQVPEQHKLNYDGMSAYGNFPMWHAGNATFSSEEYRSKYPGEELIFKNREILKQKYAPKIDNALKCDGYFSEKECIALAQAVKKLKSDNKIFIAECGSWHGRSTRVIADNMPENAVLFAVDTWLGSAAEQDTNHASARLLNSDHAYDEFCRNLWDHIQNKKVIPIRMHSIHAAKIFRDKNVKFDLIFLDAGHTYKEVVEDVLAWHPLLKEGAVFSGHDFNSPIWPEVTLAVLDLFGTDVKNPDKTNVWFTTAPISPRASNIYDCFIFNNELDLLELRFKTLFDVVDRFVIVEATSTHQRKPKPLHFQNNLDKFGKYLHKVTHIICEFPPELNPNAGNDVEAGELYWQIERFQRNKIMDGLSGCKDNDTIIISDLDEIPNPEVIKNYRSGDGIKSLEMNLYYYNLNCKAEGKWCEAKIAPYCTVRAMSPCDIRYAQAERILNGGKHCSYFGGVDAIIEKINNTAHREYNTNHYKNPERIKNCIDNCLDIFERPNEKFIKIDEN